MAIVYSYSKVTTPLDTDVLLLTDTTVTAGKRKNKTKSIAMSDVAAYVLSTPTAAITGSGTQNTFPIFTASKVIGDSIITQSSNAAGVVVAGALNVNDDATFLGDLSANSLEVTSTSTFGSNVNFNNADVNVNNTSTLVVSGPIKDNSGGVGTSGQVLSSTVTGVSWVNASGGGGASDLNGLTDCLVDGSSVYVSNVPSGLSGNPANNTVLGEAAANSLTTGNDNVVIGSTAMDANTDGSDNVAVGYSALGAETSGDRNTAIGYEALTSQNQTFSAHNTAIGWRADDGTVTGFHRTCLGASSGRGSGNGSNITNVGYSAIESSNTASNEVTLGNSSVATLRCAVTSITSISDERDKSEIKDLEYGLDFIDSLQPREFVWDNRPEINQDGEEYYSSNKGKKDFGFIAQEVKELDNDTLRLVYDNNPDKLELSYGKLVPILVQAIKELKAEVELLKS
jgi:hypothetical protein